MQFDARMIALIAVSLILLIVLWQLIRKRLNAGARARFKKASTAFLADFLIPDGEGGEIHIENAMLCKRGIVVVNIKDVAGNVFGSDTMLEWVVITGDQRFTFSNPQDGLYDRTAAVKRIVPDVPVLGYIAFTDSAQFTKGYPKHVISLSALLEELETEHAQQSAAPEAFWPSWEKLAAAATDAQVDELAREQA